MKNPLFKDLNFDDCPFIVLWELTRACDLVCKHCRAEAQPLPDPHELSTQETFDVIDEIRSFHPSAPILIVLTGGDPFKRADIMEIIHYAAEKDLRVTITPSGTGQMKRDDFVTMKKNGLIRVAVSLDGSYADLHDRFRGVKGSFDWSIEMLRWAREVGLETQVNTSMTRYNLTDFMNLVRVCTDLQINLWSVFFLVPTGRGQMADEISAEEFEDIFEKMEHLSHTLPFDIKSTAAPQYRRVIIEKRVARKEKAGKGLSDIGFEASRMGNRSAKGINDGNGILFISHSGEVYPSGFLPVSGGNVRHKRLTEIYRNSELFRNLRDYAQITGKCGACEFRSICGGSRARAYAVSGDYLASDPFCVHVPKKYTGSIEIAERRGGEILVTHA